MTDAAEADAGHQDASPRHGAPSIADVAAAAGVSAQTVSRVSTGYSGVRPSTRRRVLTAMRDVGYVPNSAARALKHGSFRTIGVVAHQLARTGESSTVQAVVEAAQRNGFTVTLMDVPAPTSDDVSAAAAGLAASSVDGLIIIRAESLEPESLVLPHRLPVVVSDSHLAGLHPSVATDGWNGAVRAVEHLLDLGHRTVHHLAGPDTSVPANQRLDAWQHVLSHADCPVPPPHRGAWSAAAGYQRGRDLIAQAHPGEVTAVFCANDLIALGFYRAAYEAGLRIPQDVSVIGFDNVPEAAQYWPPLTSIDVDFRAIGQHLLATLVHEITTGERPQQNVLVPVQLVHRASTGPPPPAP